MKGIMKRREGEELTDRKHGNLRADGGRSLIPLHDCPLVEDITNLSHLKVHFHFSRAVHKYYWSLIFQANNASTSCHCCFFLCIHK